MGTRNKLRNHFPTLVLTKSGSKGTRQTVYLSIKARPSVDNSIQLLSECSTDDLKEQVRQREQKDK